LEPFFFGPQDRLFGAFFPSAGSIRGQSVLIPSPPFGDAIRSHWTLRRIAEQLAEGGYDVLRFDLSASGHSMGCSREIQLSDWMVDCESALRELSELSGSPTAAAVGVRLSACLIAMSPQDFDRFVVWDPIWSGADYVTELRRLRKREETQSTRSPTLLDDEFGGQQIHPELIAQLDNTIAPQRRREQAIPICSNGTATRSPSAGAALYDWSAKDLDVFFAHPVVDEVCALFGLAT
jgi:hypothetical protein